MAQSVNPSLVTQDLTFCADTASALRLPSSIKDVADKIASLSSKSYTTYTSGGVTYYVWTYTSSGNFNVGDLPVKCDVLLVAGGGGGGAYAAGGGGGAGGVRALSKQTVPAGNNVITIGAGGAGGIWTTPLAEKGNDTLWNSGTNYAFSGPVFFATGGGLAGRGWGSNPGGAGGCGGGGGGRDASSGPPYVAGAGGSGNEGSYTPVEGYDGGDGYAVGVNNGAGGGGGGAAAVGTDANPAGYGTAGSGGAGLANAWQTGSNQYYGGGGGGGSYQGGDGTGGTGGGGNGGGQYNKTPGTANTGGGGGGSDDYLAVINAGAAGGSGIVVIRLADESGSTPKSVLYDLAGGDSGQMYCGSCVDFDGTDAYVTYGDVDWLDGLTTISVCCWLYQDGAPPNAAGIFVSKDNAIECWTKQSSTNQFVLSINNNHQIFSGASTPATGEWVYVVMTWNSTGDVRKLYLNGALADTNTSGSQSGNSINNTAQGLAIGARASKAYEIDGKISDTKIFSKELSAANVKELYDDSKVIIPTKNDASGGFLSQTDLALWAPLTDGAGSYAYDGSGHGRDGTYTGTSFLTGQPGCPQLVEGYNRPMWFDGSNDVVQNGSPSFPTGAATRTIAGWVWSSVAAGGVFGYGTTSGSSNSIFEFYDYGAGGIRLHFGTYNSGGSTVLSSNTWYHLAATYDGTTAKVYINGVLDHTNTRTLVTGSDFARIGGNNWGSSAGTFFDGTINEVVFYNTALSLAQVQALAATGPNGGPLPPDPMSLSNSSDIVAYWRNDSNITWADRSGNGYTGTVVGSPDALLFKQGINGQKNVNTGRDNQGFPLKFKNVGAVGFNGSDNYIQIPQFDFTSTHTFSWWFNPLNLTEKYTGGYAGHMLAWGYAPTIRIYLLTTGKIKIYAYATSSATFSPTNFSVSVGEWAHITYTADYDSGEALLYKNGVLTDTVDISSLGAWSYTGASNNYDFIDFGRNVSNNNIFYAGSLGNVQIYNRALTQTEIKRNFATQANRFQVPRGIVTSGLVLHLDAGDLQSYPGSGSTWYDIASRYSTGGVGANYDGTLVGTTFSTGPSRIVFTGNDEVTWTTKPINAGTFTAMAFFKRTGDSSGSETHCFFNSEGTSDVGFMVSFNESTWLVNYNGQKGTSGVGNYSVSSTTAMTLNTWRHIAVSWNNSTNSGAAKIYIDGVLENTATPVATVSETSSVNFWMGANETNRGLVGDMGTFLGYDRQLSDAEVAQNFRVQRERFV